MGSDETCIELRVCYRNRPAYVARLGGRCPRFGLQREFNPFFKGREILPNGSRQELHLLPDESQTYEVKEWRDGKWNYWYAATSEGDAQIHRISRYGAEVVAKRMMSIREVIRECPETLVLEVEEE